MPELTTTQQFQQCSIHREGFERRMKKLESEQDHEMISDLRVEIAKLQSNLKITWLLLMMVISGLISVAFSVWKGGLP